MVRADKRKFIDFLNTFQSKVEAYTSPTLNKIKKGSVWHEYSLFLHFHYSNLVGLSPKQLYIMKEVIITILTFYKIDLTRTLASRTTPFLSQGSNKSIDVDRVPQ